MKGIYRFLFLFSSFGPLYLILAVKSWFDAAAPRWFTYGLLGLFVLSLIAFWVVTRGLNRASSDRYSLVDLKPKDGDVFPYLMAYIPSLIFKNLFSLEIGIPLIILYFLVFVLYYRLDSPYINPYFAIFGYRISEGRMKGSRSPIILISRGLVLTGEENLMLHEVATGHSALYFYEYNRAVDSG